MVFGAECFCGSWQTTGFSLYKNVEQRAQYMAEIQNVEGVLANAGFYLAQSRRVAEMRDCYDGK